MREQDIVVSGGYKKRRRSRGVRIMDFDAIKNFIKRLLP
jgi:hypothetical protein